MNLNYLSTYPSIYKKLHGNRRDCIGPREAKCRCTCNFCCTEVQSHQERAYPSWICEDGERGFSFVLKLCQYLHEVLGFNSPHTTVV